MTRRLPPEHDLPEMRNALQDASYLWTSFIWEHTEQGHEFWSEQAHNGMTEDGRAALTEMIALAEAAEWRVAA